MRKKKSVASRRKSPAKSPVRKPAGSATPEFAKALAGLTKTVDNYIEVAMRREEENKRIWEELRASDKETREKWEELRASDRETREWLQEMKTLRQEQKTLQREQEGLKKTIGLMAESVFRHNFAELMGRFGIPLTEDDIRIRVRRANHSGEYDIVGVNCDTTVVTEVKARLTMDDVQKLRGKLDQFRLEHPKLARPRLVGAVAGLSVNADAASLARKFGFIVLKLNGADISSQNPKGFAPRGY